MTTAARAIMLCLCGMICVSTGAHSALAQAGQDATQATAQKLVSETGNSQVPDLIFRKSGGPVVGHLQSMLAFATVYDDEALLRQRLDVNKRAAERNSENDEDTSQPTNIPKTTFTDGFRRTSCYLLWGTYRVEIQTSSPVWFYKPNPYHVKGDYPIKDRQWFGTCNYMTPSFETRLIAHERKHPAVYSEKGCYSV